MQDYAARTITPLNKKVLGAGLVLLFLRLHCQSDGLSFANGVFRYGKSGNYCQYAFLGMRILVGLSVDAAFSKCPA